eukprot:1129079-Pleurochrysis_carterae.AAC.1
MSATLNFDPMFVIASAEAPKFATRFHVVQPGIAEAEQKAGALQAAFKTEMVKVRRRKPGCSGLRPRSAAQLWRQSGARCRQLLAD